MLVPAGVVQRVDFDHETVDVDLTKEQVTSSLLLEAEDGLGD
ncbi:hypothetical protein [Georgenia ruanii]|nr:hypothetical protein [Georgenia ruanii]